MPKLTVERKKVNLSISIELWEKCQAYRQRYGINWSRVAEMAFLELMQSIDDIQANLPQDPADHEQYLIDYASRKLIGLLRNSPD